MDVADLLQLQRALQSQSVVQITAHEEDGVVVEVLGSKVLNVVPVGKHLLHLTRQFPEGG